jgi:hypothetical protein
MTMPQPTIRTGLNALPTLAAAACVAATLGLADVVRADEVAPGGAQGPPTGDSVGQRYRNVTGPDVQRLLLKLGYTARLYKGSKGKPKIESGSDGDNFLIGFYGCTSAAVRRCEGIQFYAGYRMKAPIPLETLNDWNRLNRYARAYREGTDRNITFIEMDMPFMGVSDMTFRAQLKMFNRLNALFRRKIGYTRK